MKTIGFFNIKGGVGKTTTSINFAHQLSLLGKRVLLVDLDMQGNSSRFFGCYDKDRPSVSDLLIRKANNADVIRKTEYPNIDVIPANMSLITSDKEIMLDTLSPQQTRLKTALDLVADSYDYCVIDCPTYLTIAMINGLVAMNDLIIPIEIDEQAFEGLEYVLATVNEVKPLNPVLRFAGCLVTVFKPSSEFNQAGLAWLTNAVGGKVFATRIRATEKVTESIAMNQPISVYSPRCLASKNYKDFVEEYLEKDGAR